MIKTDKNKYILEQWNILVCQLLIEFVPAGYSQMFKKAGLPKLSSKNLKPLPLEFAELDDNYLEEMNKSIGTPRHETFKIKNLQGTKTQKLQIAKKAITNRQKLPSLPKNINLLKENLLDLDLCFQLDSSKVCQTGKITERNNFVIRRVATPTKSSNGKDTSAGSSDSSLQNTQQLHINLKNATDSPQIKLIAGRGKSYTKNLQPCRIVNSKKLPFDLNPKNHKKPKSNIEELDLDLSLIERCEEDERLISLESIQNLCSLLQ